jgi:hypothetical protein
MTGYQSKKAAAQDKLVVTDIDGHVVRDAGNWEWKDDAYTKGRAIETKLKEQT